MLSQFLTKRKNFCACALFLIFTSAKAQSTYPYYFAIPDYVRQPNSLYNKIDLIDLRGDTLSMGFIQTGAFNKRNIVVPKAPMRGQINFNLASQIDNSAKDNELVLQLRSLEFAEVSGSFTEEGFFRMKADLFAKTERGYQKINSIDTVARVSAADVSNKLLKKGGEVFAGFIGAKLATAVLPGNAISYNEIAKADSIEKSQIKVFSTNNFVDGYYATYASFKDQIPDGEIFVKDDKIESNSVKAYDTDRKLKTVKPANTYAIVYKGIAYMGTVVGYSRVTKVGTELIFVAPIGSAATTPVFYYGGGAIGGAISGLATVLATPKTRYYNTKINHFNGTFIPFEQVKENQE